MNSPSSNVPRINFENGFTIPKQIEGVFDVLVTPDIATQMLEYNTINRFIRKTYVDFLRRSIVNGEWQSDHCQPIAFSARNLIDGQHRLLGIAASGKSVHARVAFGVREALRSYIDIGISRTLDDQVSFVDDLKLNRIVAQLLNFSAAVKNKRFARLTASEAKELFDQHSDALVWASNNKSKDRGIGQTAVWWALCEYRERSRKSAESFAIAFKSADCDINQARILQHYLISQFIPRNRGKMQFDSAPGATIRLINYYKSVYAMRAHLHGVEIKKLLVGAW